MSASRFKLEEEVPRRRTARPGHRIHVGDLSSPRGRLTRTKYNSESGAVQDVDHVRQRLSEDVGGVVCGRYAIGCNNAVLDVVSDKHIAHVDVARAIIVYSVVSNKMSRNIVGVYGRSRNNAKRRILR
jgi:hypothetical protein